MKSYAAACFSAFLILSLAACGSAGDSRGTFDNTGGAPPPGDAIEFQSASFALDDLCRWQLGAASFAVLARAEADIPVIDGDEACTAALRTALSNALAALTSDQALAIFPVVFGGCLQSYEVAAVTRDGLALRPWVLLHDTTWGAVSAQMCTLELGVKIEALVVDGAAGANAIELHSGSINPNYPRNPEVPVF